MSLLSTMLAFVLVPLVKRSPDEDKEKIAALEAEVARLGEEKDAWARAYEAQGQRLQTRLDEERERGILDRQQTRHWRSQSDYWQQAYTSLAAPNQWSQEAQARLQNGPMLGQSFQQYHPGAQQLTPQQLGLSQQAQQLSNNLAQQTLFRHPNYNDLGWLCTCVPDRATALSRAEPGEAVRVDSSETIREQARRLMAAPFRSAIGA